MSIKNVILLQIAINWKNSNVYFKPEVLEATCEKSAVPPPPTPIRNVTLSDFVIDDEVKFYIEWLPPAFTNGVLTHYYACLGGRELEQFEEYDADTVSHRDKNDTDCRRITIVS